ncbi:hypothetical protein [Pannonibacter phragmitetus]|uniref:hypothetical protein n=1 Tax=Pannonibacter phragmitetus TaxID=121719 RepID=UPI000B96EE37|nr:hypothetical protein [Pannonibacter phragmitetus]
MYATYLRLDLMVWDSDREVIRAARSKLAQASVRDPAKRDARKRFYRAMLLQHTESQRLAAHFRL